MLSSDLYMYTWTHACKHAYCTFLQISQSGTQFCFLEFNRCLPPMVSEQLYTVGFSLSPAQLRKWVLLPVIACGIWVLLTCAVCSRKNREARGREITYVFCGTCLLHVNVSCSLQTFKEIIETGIGCLPLLSRLSPSEAPYNVTFPWDTGGTLVCRLLMTLYFFTWFACLIFFLRERKKAR